MSARRSAPALPTAVNAGWTNVRQNLKTELLNEIAIEIAAIEERVAAKLELNANLKRELHQNLSLTIATIEERVGANIRPLEQRIDKIERQLADNNENITFKLNGMQAVVNLIRKELIKYSVLTVNQDA